MSDKNIDDLDDFDFDFDTDSEADTPKSGRQVAEESLKTVGSSFMDSFKNEAVLKQATDVADGAFRGLVGEDSYRVASEVGKHLKDTGKNAAKEITQAAAPLAEQIRDKLGEDSFIGGLADKVVKMANTSTETNGESEESKISNKLLGLLENQTAKNTDSVMQETLQLQGNMDNKKLLGNIAASNFNLLKFHNTNTQDYYRKSIELKYRLLFKTEQMFGLQVKAFDTFKNQLENVVKNTSLPDYLKIRGAEAMKQQLMVNLRNDTYQSFMRNRTWIKTFKDNTSDLIGGIGSGVAEGLNGASNISSAMLDQMENADPMMRQMVLEEMGAGAAGKTRGLLGKLSGKLLSKTATGRKLDNMVERLTIDPLSIIGEQADKYGDDTLRGKMLGNLANMFTTAKDYREVTGLDNEDMNSASYLDIRTKESINIVIPGYLSDILSAITGKSGKKYDYATRSFISVEDSINSVKDDIGSNYGTKYSDGVDSAIRTMSYGSGVDLPKELKEKFIAKLLDGGLSDSDISADTIVSDEFLEGFSKKDKLIIRSMVDASQRDKDGLISLRKKNDITRGLNSAFSISVKPEDHIKALIADGKQQELVKLGILKYDKARAAYNINNKKYNEYVKKGILDHLDTRVDERTMSKKQTIAKEVSSKLNIFKNDINSKAEKIIDRYIDEDGVVNTDNLKSDYVKAKEETVEKYDKTKETVSKLYEEVNSVEKLKGKKEELTEKTKKYVEDKVKETIDNINDDERVKKAKEKLNESKKYVEDKVDAEKLNNAKNILNTKARDFKKNAEKRINGIDVSKITDSAIYNNAYIVSKESIDNGLNVGKDKFEEYKKQTMSGLENKINKEEVVSKFNKTATSFKDKTNRFKTKAKEKIDSFDINTTFNPLKEAFETNNERLKTGFNSLIHPEKGDKKNVFVEIRDILESLKPKKKSAFDGDGDGDRDGGWRDIFSRKKKKNKDGTLSKKEIKEGKKGKGILGMIMGALTGLAGMAISGVTGLLGAALGTSLVLAVKGVVGAFGMLGKASWWLMKAMGSLAMFIGKNIVGKFTGRAGASAAASTAASVAGGGIMSTIKNFGKKLWGGVKRNKLASVLGLAATYGAVDMFGDDQPEVMSQFQQNNFNPNQMADGQQNVPSDQGYGMSDMAVDVGTTMAVGAGIDYGVGKVFNRKPKVPKQVESTSMLSGIKKWLMSNKGVAKIMNNKAAGKIFKKLPLVRYLFGAGNIKKAYNNGGLWSGIKAGLWEVATVIPVVAAYDMLSGVADSTDETVDHAYIKKQQDKNDIYKEKQSTSLDTFISKLDKMSDKDIDKMEKKDKEEASIAKSKEDLKKDLDARMGLHGKDGKGKESKKKDTHTSSGGMSDPFGLLSTINASATCMLRRIFNPNAPCTGTGTNQTNSAVGGGDVAMDDGNGSSNAGSPITNPKHNLLFDRIAKGEGTYKNGKKEAYNITLGYDKYAPANRKKLWDMTIDEIYNLQRYMVNHGGSTGACGKYQFVEQTLREVVAQTGTASSTLFDAKTQDMLILHRLSGKRKYKEWLEGGITDNQFIHNLSLEFASIGDPKLNGAGHYPPYENPPATTVEAMQNTLNKMRGVSSKDIEQAKLKQGAEDITEKPNAPAARVRHTPQQTTQPTRLPSVRLTTPGSYTPTKMPSFEQYMQTNNNAGSGSSITASSGPCSVNYLHPDRGSWDAHCTAPAVTAFKKLCSAMGGGLTILSAYRSPSVNSSVGGAKRSQHKLGKAFDVEWVDKSQAGKVQMIHAAKAAGFRGIGIYNSFIHCDVRDNDMAWGSDGHSASLPGWARSALNSAPATGSGPSLPSPSNDIGIDTTEPITETQQSKGSSAPSIFNPTTPTRLSSPGMQRTNNALSNTSDSNSGLIQPIGVDNSNKNIGTSTTYPQQLINVDHDPATSAIAESALRREKILDNLVNAVTNLNSKQPQLPAQQTPHVTEKRPHRPQTPTVVNMDAIKTAPNRRD